MRLPRLQRLWQEPSPDSRWTIAGTVWWVWYLGGSGRQRHVVLCSRSAVRDALGESKWSRERRVPLARWRREWVWMREVAE